MDLKSKYSRDRFSQTKAKTTLNLDLNGSYVN